MAEEDINNTTEQHSKGNEPHEYDGILELNNPAPFWIVLIFIATIGFSFFYLIQNFGYPGIRKDQISEYKSDTASMTSLNTKKGLSASTGNANQDSKQIIASGAKLFNEKGCIACHGMNGEGNAIGPNLTDKFWLNGCKEESLIKIITEGKPEKGMTSFKSTMTAEQIMQVANFILSLAGSNPANAKAAQGDECK